MLILWFLSSLISSLFLLFNNNILLNKEGNNTILIITNLLLSAIKMNLTFRLDRDALQIQYLPNMFNTLLYTVFSAVISVSDCTLSLSELKMYQVYEDQKSLQGKIISFYKNQFFHCYFHLVFLWFTIGRKSKIFFNDSLEESNKSFLQQIDWSCLVTLKYSKFFEFSNDKFCKKRTFKILIFKSFQFQNWRKLQINQIHIYTN